MKYLCIFTPDPNRRAELPTPEAQAALGKFAEDNRASGVLLASGGMYPVAHGGAHLVVKGGEIKTLDGPFAESKELIGGFALIDVKDRAEALAVSRRFLSFSGDGEALIYEIEEAPPGCS
jgi:hypothetical protein